MHSKNKHKINSYDAIIIGGGFYGTEIARYLKLCGAQKVLLLEKESKLLQRASYNNQARIHNGYHYPRNLVTAMRSHINFPRYINDYYDCVDDSFEKVYAISKILSKVNANQFRLFCERIGSPAEPAKKNVRDLFNADLIEDVFTVCEYAFDADKLAKIMQQRLQEVEVEVRYETEAIRVSGNAGELKVETQSVGQTEYYSAPEVFNCTYSQINKLLIGSRLPVIPLKHELTELALVNVPDQLKRKGITVMCGPFFSCMPFPAQKGVHSFSHVRYTPHHTWHDGTGSYRDSHQFLKNYEMKSAFIKMKKDAERYLPVMEQVKQIGSLWEIKTVLPLNENDDGRPILFKRNYGLPGLTCVMGGKIDNIYDVLNTIDQIFEKQTEPICKKLIYS